MISVIVYGRNDGYAPDLHKRAALGLNSLGFVLTAPGDEILFVDYNTPDEYPTFPEAIADTLTDATLRKLRILRARPDLHASRPDASLPVIEALARNIAIRRSDPSNRWILSTNPDMILLPEGGSLSEIAAGLPDGFYGAPRFEIPAMIWERFRRDDPEGVFARLPRLASSLHLDEAVLHDLPQVGFDAVGDFQLALRRDVFEIGGFDEAMVSGWHVDSNFAARLASAGRPIQAIGRRLRAYHCEHSRSFGPKHAPGRIEDDFERHVALPQSTGCCQSPANFGAPESMIEEIQFDRRQDAAELAASAIGAPQQSPLTSTVGASSFGAPTASASHTLPFLLDTLIHRALDVRICWVGVGPLRKLARSALVKAAFPPPVDILSGSAQALESFDLFIFDFDELNLSPGSVSFPQTRAVVDLLAQVVELETARLEAGAQPRPIIGVNAIHSPFESLILESLDCVLSPFTTRIRRGFARPRPEAESWFRELRVGSAASRANDGSFVATTKPGHVFFGPWRRPPPGAYNVACRIANVVSRASPQRGAAAVLEAVVGDERVASVDLSLQDLSTGVAMLKFNSPWQALPPYRGALELRLWTSGEVLFQIDDVVVAPVRRGA